GLLHAALLRSPHAHARFRINDTAKARALAGVVLILTGADVAGLGSLPSPSYLPGARIEVPPYPLLAQCEVRHLGDGIARVCAATLDRAQEAAEAIVVDWEPLPHVIGAAAALADNAPQVWPQHRGTLVFETVLGDARATTRAFAEAAHEVSLDVVNQ